MRTCLVALALAAASVHALARPVLGAPQEGKPARGVAAVTYVVEVDPARVRAAGWCAQAASDGEALDAVVALVRRRLTAMEREVVLTTQPESRRFELRMPQVQPRDRELFADLLESLGRCEFLFEASKDDANLGFVVEFELAKLLGWRKENPDAPLAEFHQVAAPTGPHARLEWIDTRWGDELGPPMPLVLPARPEDHVGAAALERAYATTDALEFPAIGFELRAARSADFERVTEEHVGRRLGIVLDGVVRAAPTLNSKLSTHGMIEGRFQQAEVDGVAAMLHAKQGPLLVLEIR
jgi:preprotein translocase subunit SecD